jgi:general secretion pathway protein H
VRPTQGEAGFTLIELLVVVVIMGLAYSLAAPLVGSGVGAAELKASARQLAAGLRKARSDAIARRQETVLTLDLEAKTFQLSNDQRVFRLPREVDVGLFTAQSERMGDNRASIRFFPDGGSTGGRVTVTGKQRTYEVDVNWLTGQVAILD